MVRHGGRELTGGPPSATDMYNPEYEWPGDSTSTERNDNPTTSDSPLRKRGRNMSSLRLIVARSSILPSEYRIATADAHWEVQFGRDIAPNGSITPRIRLKEMEVSKLHATAYWDGTRREWSVVDMGSKHGTFLRSNCGSSELNGIGVRLSPSRVASIPRRLNHMDQLTLGSTTFIIHIHDEYPCEECSPLAGEDIPLFPVSKHISAKRTRDVAGLDSNIRPYSPKPGGDPRKALTMLKHSLLQNHDARNSPSPIRTPDLDAQYVDRAARRRQFHPSSHPDSPGVSPLPVRVDSPSSDGILENPTDAPVLSQPPVPLPTTNIGHRLLILQGWEPGSALGMPPEDGRVALIEPLELSTTKGRSGLGIRKNASETSDNREKRKRFSNLR
ncbi:hypothetical protein K443DRAFT_80848 [Laccaria amethystina LaAM-08-1]|uniref:Unplaced genomic scaffold K443scaffold_1, whole genome shotgun sequence n=1 Tax=Laccaria amethystina LaAM-08-1 TaxID=1095629 RepID=A0A0C9YIJ5_9AGAR|nr:hypothetical protein K443DRAFT_80848 [Laccaria amethystina LaAM-08-1]